MKEGIELALSRSDIAPEYFDAVTDNEAESINLEQRTNAKRFDASRRADR